MKKFHVKIRIFGIVLNVVVLSKNVSDALQMAISELHYFLGKPIKVRKISAIVIKCIKE